MIENWTIWDWVQLVILLAALGFLIGLAKELYDRRDGNIGDRKLDAQMVGSVGVHD